MHSFAHAELASLLNLRYIQVKVAQNSLCSTVSCFYMQHLMLLLSLKAERVLFDLLMEEGGQRQGRGWPRLTC